MPVGHRVHLVREEEGQMAAREELRNEQVELRVEELITEVSFMYLTYR